MEMWDELDIVFPWLFRDPDAHAVHLCLSEVSRCRRGTIASCDGFSFPSLLPTPLSLLYNTQTQGASSEEYKAVMHRFSDT